MISEWWRTEEHREHEIEREGESTKIGTHFFQETFTVHRPPRRACKAVDRRSVLRPSSRSMNPSLENKSKRAFQSQKICCSFRCFAFGASSPFTSSWQSLSQDPDLSYSERAEERRSRIGALRDDSEKSSSSFQRFASTFLVKEQREHEIEREGESTKIGIPFFRKRSPSTVLREDHAKR